MFYQKALNNNAMKKIREYSVRKLSAIKERLTAIKADPRKVSMGYAFGIFLASTPFIGVKVFIAIFFTWLLKWNKVAAIIGVYHVNLFTAPLFYGFSFLIGNRVLGTHLCFAIPGKMTLGFLLGLFQGNISIFYSLLLGGFILGVPMALGAYWLSMKMIRSCKTAA